MTASHNHPGWIVTRSDSSNESLIRGANAASCIGESGELETFLSSDPDIVIIDIRSVELQGICQEVFGGEKLSAFSQREGVWNDPPS